MQWLPLCPLLCVADCGILLPVSFANLPARFCNRPFLFFAIKNFCFSCSFLRYLDTITWTTSRPQLVARVFHFATQLIKSVLHLCRDFAAPVPMPHIHNVLLWSVTTLQYCLWGVGTVVEMGCDFMRFHASAPAVPTQDCCGTVRHTLVLRAQDCQVVSHEIEDYTSYEPRGREKTMQHLQ